MKKEMHQLPFWIAQKGLDTTCCDGHIFTNEVFSKIIEPSRVQSGRSRSPFHVLLLVDNRTLFKSQGSFLIRHFCTSTVQFLLFLRRKGLSFVASVIPKGT